MKLSRRFTVTALPLAVLLFSGQAPAQQMGGMGPGWQVPSPYSGMFGSMGNVYSPYYRQFHSPGDGKDVWDAWHGRIGAGDGSGRRPAGARAPTTGLAGIGGRPATLAGHRLAGHCSLPEPLPGHVRQHGKCLQSLLPTVPLPGDGGNVWHGRIGAEPGARSGPGSGSSPAILPQPAPTTGLAGIAGRPAAAAGHRLAGHCSIPEPLPGHVRQHGKCLQPLLSPVPFAGNGGNAWHGRIIRAGAGSGSGSRRAILPRYAPTTGLASLGGRPAAPAGFRLIGHRSEPQPLPGHVREHGQCLQPLLPAVSPPRHERLG